MGVKNGINKVREILRQKYDGWDGQFSFIHHGTTVATNAVLEGKGARSGLIVTAGHKDVLSVRRSQIPGGLGAWINFVPPEPISMFFLSFFFFCSLMLTRANTSTPGAHRAVP